MKKRYEILVPEYVPLSNKGEEAIIRGMADVIFPDEPSTFHVLDMEAVETAHLEGLDVHPGSWFYSRWRSQEFGMGLSGRRLWGSGCSLLRNGLNYTIPAWVKLPQLPLIRSAARMRHLRQRSALGLLGKDDALRRMAACDYLIAGHDGALNEYDCHVIDAMCKLGLRFGIFGSTMKPRVRNSAIVEIFGRTLRKADFVYCRDEIAAGWARKHFPDVRIDVAPDPAFGMRPARPERVDEILRQEALEGFFERPVAMLTPAETAYVARRSFDGHLTPSAKRDAHRVLLASVVRCLVEECGANVLFLPHAVGPTPELDDRSIGWDILGRAKVSPERGRVLETEYGARDLKALIGRAELLVAERIHSIIGAVGMRTPFLCLGSRADNRVSGIVGGMLGAKDAIYFLNEPTESEILGRVVVSWNGRHVMRERLTSTKDEVEVSLRTAAARIREAIGRVAAWEEA
ncbi:MAG: polysaccharide pyruvyl transferase family protein [Polyangiaceae bacterium]|nr:polysaccharide pyruvyl transferase family protein [Polyangiaceae bacterium]